MLEREVEDLMDKYGVSAILDTMATISEYKAEYVAESWQDRPLARAWHQAAARLSRLAGARNILMISGRARP